MPAAVVVLVEALALLYATLHGRLEPFGWVLYALPAGLLAWILTQLVVFVARSRDAWTWFVVSACVNFMALFLGFFLWLIASTVGCGGADGCFG